VQHEQSMPKHEPVRATVAGAGAPIER